MSPEEIKKKIDELTKNSDLLIGHPQTIEQMKKLGLPIKSQSVTYEEYIENLLNQKRTIANELVGKLPQLKHSIANATVQSLYEEIQECFVLGISGAAITLSVILLELSLKYRLFEERLKKDPKTNWSHIEQLDVSKTINALRKFKVISTKEKRELDNFNVEVRNTYIHYNVQKIIKDMHISEISSVDVNSGKVTVHHNLWAADHQHLWFSAKKYFDKATLEIRVKFCIHWTNKLLEVKKV